MGAECGGGGRGAPLPKHIRHQKPQCRRIVLNISLSGSSCRRCGCHTGNLQPPPGAEWVTSAAGSSTCAALLYSATARPAQPTPCRLPCTQPLPSLALAPTYSLLQLAQDLVGQAAGHLPPRLEVEGLELPILHHRAEPVAVKESTGNVATPAGQQEACPALLHHPPPAHPPTCGREGCPAQPSRPTQCPAPWSAPPGCPPAS